MSDANIEKWNNSDLKKIICADDVNQYRNTIGIFTGPTTPESEVYRTAFNKLALIMIGVQTGAFDVNVVTDKTFISDFLTNKTVNSDLLMKAFINNENNKEVSKSETSDSDGRIINLQVLNFRHNILRQVDPSVYSPFLAHEITEIISKEPLNSRKDIDYKEFEDDNNNDSELNNFENVKNPDEIDIDAIKASFTFLIDNIQTGKFISLQDKRMKTIAKIKNYLKNTISKNSVAKSESTYKEFRNLIYAFDIFIETYEKYRADGKFV